LIWNLNRLKPHYVVCIVSLVLFLKLLVHRSKKLSVSVARDVEAEVSEVVSWVRFVQWIIAYDILVA